MARTVKHLSLHRIDGTELRVVSDIERSIFNVLGAEQSVIERYTTSGQWPHRRVTFFVLADLQPLVRQLKLTGAVALASRPAACIYDLMSLDDCYVFVNEQVMKREGYWDDSLSTLGLLAHEHAHPLAENDTTRASRRLRADLTTNAPEPVKGVLAQLAETVAWGAPREVFTNQTAIACGFGDALRHLNRKMVDSTISGAQQRGVLQDSLNDEVARGTLSHTDAGRLLWIGDLQANLPLAIEVAPFHTAGRADDVHELEDVLNTQVFARLEPGVWHAYTALRQHYQALQPDWNADDTIEWSGGALRILAAALADKDMTLKVQFTIGEGRSGWLV